MLKRSLKIPSIVISGIALISITVMSVAYFKADFEHAKAAQYQVQGASSPTVALTSPTTNQSFTDPATVNLSATASAGSTGSSNSCSTTYPNDTSMVGTNLDGIADYEPQEPLVNVFTSARQWFSMVDNGPFDSGGPLDLDSDGWVKSLPQGHYAQTGVMYYKDSQGNYPSGRYVLLYDGEGTFSFEYAQATVVSQTPGRIVVDLGGGTDNNINIAERTTNPSNYARNIRFMKIDYENTYQTEPFNPLFINSLKPFNTLRFMDWMGTNGSKITTWASRPKPTDYTYQRAGMPLEIMVDLSNKLHSDPWFNIPQAATDDYIQNFAQYVKDHLDPTLKAHVEYSNETWNGGFSAGSYMEQQGINQGIGGPGFDTSNKYYSRRSVQIWNIWEQVYGGDKTKFYHTMGTQVVNYGVTSNELDFENAYLHVDEVAGAPYFNKGDIHPNSYYTTPDQILDDALINIDGPVKDAMIGTKNTMDSYNRGIKFVLYESGADVGDSSQSDERIAALAAQANRSARMHDIYVHFYDMLKQNGASLIVQFNDISSYSRYGQWGALQYRDDNLNTTPKYKGITDWISANPTSTTRPNSGCSGSNTPTVSKVEFFRDTTLLGQSIVPVNGNYTYSWTNAPSGTYILTAKVTTSDNQTATSTPVSITVQPADRGGIGSPTSNLFYLPPYKVTFTPNKATPAIYGQQPLTISVQGVTGFSGTCTFKIKPYASADSGFDTYTPKLSASTVTYQNGTCSTTLPANQQSEPKWDIQIRLTDGSGNITGSDPSYFMLYGAVGVVSINGSAL